MFLFYKDELYATYYYSFTYEEIGTEQRHNLPIVPWAGKGAVQI